MTPAFVLAHTIPAALSLLPAAMDTPAARATLLAIGLQESKFQHRRQVRGPARGYWQFEMRGGVVGVLRHVDTGIIADSVCVALDYPATDVDVYDAISDNDVLACAFARLLLWTLPGPLATRDNRNLGWDQYLAAWRPGRPHPETWARCWERAWALVGPMEEQQP